MSRHEGVEYGEDKIAVILDIGTAYTKCGFAGENGPRCIVPTLVRIQTTGKTCKLTECQDDAQLYEALKDFLHYLYFRFLLVTPSERRVVICESLLCPTKFRNMLAKVLFNHFKVPSVLFVPHHVLSLFTLGIRSALVVDVGYTQTLVVPIYELTPVLKALQLAPLGAHSIHQHLESQLKEHATVSSEKEYPNKPLSSLMDHVDENIIEDIKVRCCFVTNLDRAQQIQQVQIDGAEVSKLPPPPPNVDYPLYGHSILHINGNTRETACEVLFEEDIEGISMITLILDALLEVPIDMRRTLAENVLLIGGTAMLPGFLHRLRAEMYYIRDKHPIYKSLTLPTFRFHQPPSKANYTAWLGGAIMGAMETLSSRSLARATYQQTAVVPDWCMLTTDLDLIKAERDAASALDSITNP